MENPSQAMAMGQTQENAIDFVTKFLVQKDEHCRRIMLSSKRPSYVKKQIRGCKMLPGCSRSRNPTMLEVSWNVLDMMQLLKLVS